MLLEGTDGFYEQQNRKDQGQDNSTWPMMGSMFFNARTLEVDQHTHLQDGGCQNKSTAFMVSENKRKDSNAGERICSDVEQSASQRGRDSRKEESPQSAFSTYSDPSLSDREPSAEACKRLKNNAASRRSRACRKQRFQFMQMQVKQLNISNSGLRKSLRELDRLLIEAKEILLQQATKSPNSTVQQDNQTFAYLNMVRSSSFNSETNL
ncbi:unnamed protein product [Schistocephalus solidus]|uniref:BZIP domain-containing protein n=1 Tax=Schistocephalus solidus TaxID=70667 RepID=A0A183THW2_SCHSO|nr:unnamed protein product [Schistocephalus solidus]